MSEQSQTMETIDIANGAFSVSRIGLGTWAIGGWMWGGTDERQSIETIHAAVDRGVTLFDTAPVYGFGRAEEILGKALAEDNRRARVAIATKAGLGWRNSTPYRDASKARIVKEVDNSLRRLRTDVIDLYQVHWPDPDTPISETAAAMAELYRAGKIRAIGVSNFSPEQMDEFRASAPLHAVQPPYNLFERAIEKDVLPYAVAHELATLAYGSLCRGLLSGHITEATKFSGDDLRNMDPKFSGKRRGQYLKAVHGLRSSRAKTTARTSYTSRYAGCSTAPRRRLPCGARAIQGSWIRSATSSAGGSTPEPWERSTRSLKKRSARQSGPSLWRPRKNPRLEPPSRKEIWR